MMFGQYRDNYTQAAAMDAKCFWYRRQPTIVTIRDLTSRTRNGRLRHERRRHEYRESDNRILNIPHDLFESSH